MVGIETGTILIHIGRLQDILLIVVPDRAYRDAGKPGKLSGRVVAVFLHGNSPYYI